MPVRRYTVLPSIAEYERQFIEKFGRDMTPEEKRFYQLTRDLLAKGKTKKTKPKQPPPRL